MISRVDRGCSWAARAPAAADVSGGGGSYDGLMTGSRDNPASGRVPRHEHRVRTFSRDYELIAGIGYRYLVEQDSAVLLARAVVERFSVPMPEFAFNTRRRPDTGQCWPPRRRVELVQGDDVVEAWERRRGRLYPEHGQIRLGSRTRLRTLAHELGHHLVHYLAPVGTPSHGKVWVASFDDAMAVIAAELGVARGSSRVSTPAGPTGLG